MAKKAKAADVATAVPPAPSVPTAIPRPRLHKLRVSNFRCIGPIPVEIELDDIVVLVGPNNAGKSCVLRAYEVVMSHGSAEGELVADDFPDGKCVPERCPTIELETVVYEKTAPGDLWVRTDPLTGEMFVKEKWTWQVPGKPTKVGWDVEADNWHASKGPWGAPNIAQAYRPHPHLVSTFHDPKVRASEVLGLLTTALKDRVREISKAKAQESGDGQPSDYEALVSAVRTLQKSIAVDASSAVSDVCEQLGSMIGEVFPGYTVTFDARPEDDVEKTISFFKTGPELRMGPSAGHQTTIERQGSGACRTLLWTALRILADRKTKETQSGRSHLLLMDEPEMCLHPDAIRDACRVLYDLPKTGNWQVMITTHSPVFIDLSRDNTSIVRVERTNDGVVQGTTIYRPVRAKLDDDDKAELKMLNMCDPYVAEFFFGGRTIVVEGDTEYTAFRHVLSRHPEIKNVHIVRARGKYCIASLCKVLNQFEKKYAVLHDADRELILTKKKTLKKNSAWPANERILQAVANGGKASGVRVLASIPNFEEAFFGEESDGEKPYEALRTIKDDAVAFDRIHTLLLALVNPEATAPAGCLEWKNVDELTAAVAAFDASAAVTVPT